MSWELYKRQVDEILNSDQYLNRQILDLQQKQIDKWGVEAPQPFVQENQEAIDGIKTNINNFLVILEQKQAKLTSVIVDGLPRGTAYANLDSYVNEITLINNVILKYNEIVKSYISDGKATQQTRLKILSYIMKLEEPIKMFYSGLMNVDVLLYKLDESIEPLFLKD